MAVCVDNVTRENLLEKLEEIGITKKHTENIIKKDFDDDGAKLIFVAFNSATKITEYFEPAEIAAITAGLKNSSPKKRKKSLNILLGFPKDSDSAEKALCICGILKNYIFYNNCNIIREESKKYKKAKEVKESSTESTTEIQNDPETIKPNFEELVKSVLELNPEQKKTLYNLLKQTIS